MRISEAERILVEVEASIRVRLRIRLRSRIIRLLGELLIRLLEIKVRIKVIDCASHFVALHNKRDSRIY